MAQGSNPKHSNFAIFCLKLTCDVKRTKLNQNRMSQALIFEKVRFVLDGLLMVECDFSRFLLLAKSGLKTYLLCCRQCSCNNSD